jgi:hypothetical protein
LAILAVAYTIGDNGHHTFMASGIEIISAHRKGILINGLLAAVAITANTYSELL